MAFSVQKFIKSILVREENTNTPKEMEFVPGGSASTKTILTTSQTANRTLTLPDATDTLVGLTAAQALSNKTIDGTNNTLSNIPTSALSGTIDATSIGSGTVDNTEFGYLNGVSSSIQTQLGNKASTTLDNLGTTTINAALIPDTTNAYTLGTGAKRWSTVDASTIRGGSAAPYVDLTSGTMFTAGGVGRIAWPTSVLMDAGADVFGWSGYPRVLTTKSQLSAGSASAPGSPVVKDVYYDTSDNTYKFYNGTSWLSMSAGGIGGTGTTGTIPKFSATSTLADSVIVESSGNIGIGVAPTLGKLEVSGITAASSFLFGTSSNLWYQSATETATLRIGTTPSYLNFINSSGAPMIDAPSGTLYFGTSGTVRARISPNGYLGIGGDPEVSGINTAIYAKSAFGSPTGGVPYGGIWISSTDSAAIDKGGVLSLGGSYTGTTDTRFAAIAGLKEDSTDGNYGGYLALYTRPNGGSPLERMHISASGNVGIGCTPNQKFEVQGSSGVTQRIGTSSSSFYIQHNGTSDTHIYTGDAAALRFGTNSTERLKITSSGEIITSATGGTSGSGSPAIASGTYTPTAASLTGGVSAVTPKVCHWMRIGNIVTVGLLLEITSSTAGSFTLTLPTTTANFSSALQAQGIIGTHGAVVSGKITSTVSAQTITVNATSSLTGITYDGTITYQVQ